MQLLLDERIVADGRHVKTWARLDGERVWIADDGEPGGALSVPALDRVMCHFGKPLDAEVVGDLEGDVLALGGGFALRRLRFHAIVDATGRDYLVWERAGEEPLAAIATTVTAALRHLILRLGTKAPQETEM